MPEPETVEERAHAARVFLAFTAGLAMGLTLYEALKGLEEESR